MGAVSGEDAEVAAVWVDDAPGAEGWHGCGRRWDGVLGLLGNWSGVELHNASAFVDQAPLLWPAVRRVDAAAPPPAGTGTAGAAGGLGPTAGDGCGLAAVDGSNGVHGVDAVGRGAG